MIRWSWRVGFYAFAVNGTGRYPPFTLDDVTDYPARIEIDYPERQRSGMPLIGWWLAGLPQYMIAGVFFGGGGALGWTASTQSWGGATWFGLIDALVFCAVLVLLVRGEYPRSIFDFVLGLNRWVLRVVAYAAVMTPEYPPFRVDPGEDEPAGTLTVSLPRPPGTEPSQAPPERARVPWGPGRFAGVVLAGLGGLIALVAIAAACTGIVLDQTQRDASGYLMTPARSYSTNTYALVSASYRGGTSNDWFVTRELLGTVRIRVTARRPVFVGIAPESDVQRYLGSVGRAQGTQFDTPSGQFLVRPGGPPNSLPAAERFWSASATGAAGTALTWAPRAGNWRIVLINADSTRPVKAEVSVGARLPHLLAIAIAVLGGGILLLLLSGGGLYAAVRRRG